MPGPYVDFDLRALSSLQTGQTGLCAIDDQGSVDCRYFRYDGETVVMRTDLEQPVGTGNSGVSLNSATSGCYITNVGDIDCFGFASLTEPPSLNDVNAVPMTTGLQALVYSATTIELVWDAPRDAFNVSGHEIQRNGEVVAFTRNLSSLLFTDLDPGVAESFAVRRVNLGGETGEFSEIVSVTSVRGGAANLPPTLPPYTPPDRVFEDSFLDAFVFCSDIAELLWFTDEPIEGIDGYEVHRDGEFIAFTQEEFFDDFDITEGVEHIYDVIAIDLEEPLRFLGVASGVLDISDADSDICNI